MWRWWSTSRILDLLSAIKDGTTYSAETYSRIEAILKSIANSTSYSEEARSRHEELLLAIKNGYGVGHNLFEVGTVKDYECTPSANLVITDNTISAIILAGSASRMIKKNTTYAPGNYYVSAQFSNNLPNYLVRLYDENNVIITDIVWTGWTYNIYYIAYFCVNATTINIPSGAAYFELGFALAYTPETVGTRVTISNIMLNEGSTGLPYEPYTDLQEPKTRIEEILFAIANNTQLPSTYQSDLEEAYVESLGDE